MAAAAIFRPTAVSLHKENVSVVSNGKSRRRNVYLVDGIKVMAINPQSARDTVKTLFKG